VLFADYTLIDDAISFENLDPQRFAEGEKYFGHEKNQQMLTQDGKLNLMVNDITMMRFKETVNR
jgi:hypothetical protein